MANENNKKIPCGGFYLGDGLTMDGNTLKSLGGEHVQTDWNQNDTTAKDYIKNRPCYTIKTEDVLMEETTVSFSANGGNMYIGMLTDIDIIAGDVCNISFDGVAYPCVAQMLKSSIVLGNMRIVDSSLPDTGEPFIIARQDGLAMIFTTDSSPSHVLSISGVVEEVKQIDEKYVPKIPCTWSDIQDKPMDVSYPNIEMKQDTTHTIAVGTSYIDNVNTQLDFDSNYNYYLDGTIICTIGQKTAQISLDKDYTPEGDRIYINETFDFGNDWEITVADLRSRNSSFYPGYICLHVLNIGSTSIDNVNFKIDITITRIRKVIRSVYLPDSIIHRGNVRNNLNSTVTDEPLSAMQGMVLNQKFESLAAKITEKEVILTSSTTDSTKKFKITVNDSGALTATEITE